MISKRYRPLLAGLVASLAGALAVFSLGETALAGFFGLLPFFTLALLTRQWTMFGVSLFVVWLTREAFARYCARWIGGYTGDCLGAAQQITELMLYLTIVATI